ncbi:hypothetical protein JQ615_14215 [Bradyrhizobium jicamae]|uniref:Uncharacterized protein n=1 Tax=Bradyrhizobium jicamae TaxID=280332 RepID=A0ABS5FJH6_9BRAD|nr:hypothetical protein [Bradyrhizobium jicamae]MBR0796546.1 hypothetical protein [Bradyrhizobium jicamae]MBR0935055.1 hypothetical protein [Bradyrhizobium jicamae]
MLRFVASLTLLISLISFHAAAAQDKAPSAFPQPFVGGSTTPPTDLPSGIGNYCIYENLIYSIGSPICIGQTSYVCVPSTNENEFGQRGYWTSRPADPKLIAPVCQ